MPCNDCDPTVTKTEIKMTAPPRPEKHPVAALAPFVKGHKEGHDFLPPKIYDNGDIEYPRRAGDWEYPRVPDGYERDSTNKRLFHPKWEPCKDRRYGLRGPLPCGCYDVTARCLHGEQIGKAVNYADCTTCPLRQP